jgi:SLT domain-containing protein
MGDGQGAAVFDNVIDGIASAMRLYRRKYGKKNVAQMDNGMRGYYNRNEPIGLTAMRLYGVTQKCK